MVPKDNMAQAFTISLINNMSHVLSTLHVLGTNLDKNETSVDKLKKKQLADHLFHLQEIISQCDHSMNRMVIINSSVLMRKHIICIDNKNKS